MGRLDGRAALVTGAARGIGAATARRRAPDGAKAAVCDLDEDDCAETVDAIARDGGSAIAMGCDVRSREQVEAAVERTVAELGAADILVNNAGVTRDNLLFKMSDEDWDTVIDTHLKGSFLCTRAAQRHMVERRYGKIVFLSSSSALGSRGQTNYSSAKAGLQGMARTLAIELGRFNINVNAVAPGYVSTAMTRQTAERVGADFEDFEKAAIDRIPLGRAGQPEDIANVIAFLASDEAGYVSGQVLYVNGGRRAGGAPAPRPPAG